MIIDFFVCFLITTSLPGNLSFFIDYKDMNSLISISSQLLVQLCIFWKSSSGRGNSSNGKTFWDYGSFS